MTQYYFFMNKQFPFIAKCIINALLAWKTYPEKLFLERQTKAVYRVYVRNLSAPNLTVPAVHSKCSRPRPTSLCSESRKYPFHLLGSIAPQPTDESTFRSSEASHGLEPLDPEAENPFGAMRAAHSTDRRLLRRSSAEDVAIPLCY